jgi:predicted transposase/invertase (TIGR01784 family)
MGKILFNACKAVVEQVASGKKYDIKKVYSINIVYFDIAEDVGVKVKKEYLFKANLSKFSGVHFDESIPFSQNLNPPLPANDLHPEYYLILPEKFDENIRTKFDEWVYTLKHSKVRSDFTAAGIQEAGEKLDILNMTPEQKREYERAKAEQMDYKSQLYTAELKGEMRGEIKGKAEIAKKMKQRGLSIEEISEFTGLSVEEIEAL